MRRWSVLLVAGCLCSIAGAQPCPKTGRPQTNPNSAREALDQMSLSERANSRISVEYESSDGAAIALGHEVESLWNAGSYDEALAQMDSLEARVGHVAVGNSWRTAVRTNGNSLWGRDVRIGNRDSLLEVALALDDTSGHLFAAVRRGSGVPHISVCISSDGGSTWEETFTWTGNPPPSFDAAVFDNHLYIAYSSSENAQQIRLRRLLTSTGRADTFTGGGGWIAPCTLYAGDTMREVALVATQYGVYGSLHIFTLTASGSILWSSDDRDMASWLTESTGISIAAYSGLDAAYDKGRDSAYMFFSYYDVADSLRIYGRTIGAFMPRLSLFTGRGTPTSISAGCDSIICAYEDETSSPHQVRYVISVDDGNTWSNGTLSSCDTAAESPGVLVRDTVVAAVYRHCGPNRELRFLQRTAGAYWSDPASIAGCEPYWGRPAVEFLSSGVFGVAYLSNTNPVVRGAYFDRSDWIYGIAEQPLDAGEGMMSVTPNPLKGHGRLSCTLSHPADLRVQMYDHAGRLVRALFGGHSPAGRQTVAFAVSDVVPGVYFLRLDTPGFRAVKKAVVARERARVESRE